MLSFFRQLARLQIFSFAARALCPRAFCRSGDAEFQYGSTTRFFCSIVLLRHRRSFFSDVIPRANDWLQVGLTGAFALTSAWVSSISDALHQPFCNQPGTARCALGRMPGAVA